MVYPAPDSPEPTDEASRELDSHGGLAVYDPWAPPPPPWYHAIWPWGLGGVAETMDVLILALAMFLCVRFVAHNYVVDGGSMLPTFEDTDFLIVNRLAYRTFDLSWVPGLERDEWRPFGEPQGGDVIVFQQSETRDFIKRVIATPGQTFEMRDDVVYVDGVPLEEDYIADLSDSGLPPRSFPATLVEPGKVFVLGDNRNNSQDSRSIGQVDYDQIIGRADLRYWPFDRMGVIAHTLGSGEQVASRAWDGLAALWR